MKKNYQEKESEVANDKFNEGDYMGRKANARFEKDKFSKVAHKRGKRK